MTDTSNPAAPTASTGLLCPVCRVDLVMSSREGIEIDYCPRCRGVWLDRGELDKIIERSAMYQEAPSGTQQPSAAGSEPPPPPGPVVAPQGAAYPNYPSQDGHRGQSSWGHGGHHGSGHGGFLGRLFR